MSRVLVEEGQYLKTGDTAPDLRVQCIKDNGVVRDLSSVTEVQIVLAEPHSTGTVVNADTNGDVTIGGSNGNGSNGYVEYAWASQDTDSARTLVGEVIVEPSANEQEHYPNSGQFKVYIDEGLV